jgi:hypothetical protein
MAVLLEERHKPLPDLGSLHRAWSLGGARRARTSAAKQDTSAASLAHRTPLPCNFRPVRDRSCCPLGAFRQKGVHCMCMHATRARKRRRCPLHAAG